MNQKGIEMSQKIECGRDGCCEVEYRALVAELEAILGRCVEVIDFNYMDGYQVPPELAEARAILAKARAQR